MFLTFFLIRTDSKPLKSQLKAGDRVIWTSELGEQPGSICWYSSSDTTARVHLVIHLLFVENRYLRNRILFRIPFRDTNVMENGGFCFYRVKMNVKK